jgi:hypothetical protein
MVPPADQHAVHAVVIQLHRLAGAQQAFEPTLEAQRLEAGVLARLDHRSNHRVQSGAIAAGGQDSNLLGHVVTPLWVLGVVGTVAKIALWIG